MIYEIKMPKMGESLTEGTLIKWHKKIGEFVKKDEPLFDIATDKVDTEIPSPYEGFLVEILVEESKTVPIDTVVAKISSEQLDLIDITQGNNKTYDEIEENSSQIIIRQEEKNEIAAIETNAKNNNKRFLSPLVKSIMQKEYISYDEIKDIKGSGIDGRITKNDILEYIKNKKDASKFDYYSRGIEFVKTEDLDELVYEMDNMRSKIAKNMVISRDNAVHVSEITEVDVTDIINYIEKNKKSFEENYGVKLTFTAFVVDVVSKALRQFPLLNASLDGNKIIEKKYINLGIAIALEPNGLAVPNIKNADQLNLIGLAKKLDDIKIRAKNKKLTMDDFQNGTFTITNYGVFDTLFGTPIINFPEVAILGVGAVKKRVVVKTLNEIDTIQIRSMVYLSLSHDHRLIDGMLGGKFLKYVKDELENYKLNLM
ncbi:MAG TPA: dihydrolipoamide acetyltransferase family protein [Ignavibacteriales bacterium]|nr:dihydrolipoamide acetyltransferase family protein [Ignavibacteriales bacterium]HOL80951.1 dihydrolipoamide acetyltransferase family protein [Ignavibacteriales bacterium]HOM64686.1 dihydrolipoamide acetyltransferase family protein [Ignavibacteriales bacterium]HPD66782.1 dihydrolipoamide acetyltransferase family protein [Ignavibacteriales bacterium]HPP32731.1 dihydrolipoamide acetyltransferase family protein [Ignavibacteriales bacterium]